MAISDRILGSSLVRRPWIFPCPTLGRPSSGTPWTSPYKSAPYASWWRKQTRSWTSPWPPSSITCWLSVSCIGFPGTSVGGSGMPCSSPWPCSFQNTRAWSLRPQRLSCRSDTSFRRASRVLKSIWTRRAEKERRWHRWRHRRRAIKRRIRLRRYEKGRDLGDGIRRTG